jgi:hypothetical protein
VGCHVKPGDILIALPPNASDRCDREVMGKHSGMVPIVLSIQKALEQNYLDNKSMSPGEISYRLMAEFVIGRVVGGANRGFNATGAHQINSNIYP